VSHVIERSGGSITVTDPALHQIVAAAVALVPGARPRRRKGIEIEVKAGRVRVELELAAPLGAVLPELGRDVQMHVTAALAGMCGLVVDTVGVTIAELDT
jgi:uncharacterized alkaline shock family protein YloU